MRLITLAAMAMIAATPALAQSTYPDSASDGTTVTPPRTAPRRTATPPAMPRKRAEGGSRFRPPH